MLWECAELLPPLQAGGEGEMAQEWGWRGERMAGASSRRGPPKISAALAQMWGWVGRGGGGGDGSNVKVRERWD